MLVQVARVLFGAAVVAACFVPIGLTSIAAAQTETLTYPNGEALRDQRTQRMTLEFTDTGPGPAVVAGAISTTPVCTKSASLSGGEFTVTAELVGSWEDPAGQITGRWSGVVLDCDGGQEAMSGTLTITMGQTPAGGSAVAVSLVDRDGNAYDYLYPPLGRVVVVDGIAGTPGASADIFYPDGRSWSDQRTQTLSLSFTGDVVAGEVRTTAVCEGSAALAGGRATITATLRGPWEGRASVITGSFAGESYPCGQDPVADNGTIYIAMEEGPTGTLAVVVRLQNAADSTSQAYYYAPRNQVIAVPPGAGGVTMDYGQGEAWVDGRQARLMLDLLGDRVWGEIDITPRCDANTNLPGGSLLAEARLRGDWEADGSMIFGHWGGDTVPCQGVGEPQRGDFCLFIGPDAAGERDAILLFGSGEPQTQADPYAYAFPELAEAFGTGLSPLATASSPVDIAYSGQAWADPRSQRLTMSVAGNRVTGDIDTAPVCTPTISLPGADLGYEATLDGPWEAEGTTILGFWGGWITPCGGSSYYDYGVVAMSVGGPTPGAELGLIVEMANLAGESYAYYHPLSGQMVADPAGVASPADGLFADAIASCDLPMPRYQPPYPGDEEEEDGEGDETVGPTDVDRPPPSLARSIVVLLDASGSMSSDDRMDAAKASARAVFAGMDGSVEVALVVYYDCDAIVVEQPFTTDPALLSAALEPVTPAGSTPLAAGIGVARSYLEAEAVGADLRLVVLTDGQETCGGDVAAAAAQ
ncbi:MAG: VWA domain-containing protein [Azospirillaceae bacterium]